MEEMLVESAPSQPDFTNESQNGQEAFSNEKEKVITVLVKVDEDDKNGESRPLVLTDEKIKFLQELMGSMVLGSLNGGKEKHSDKSYKKEDTTCWECGGNGHIKSECPTFIRRNKNELSSKQSGNRDQMRNIAGSKYGAGIRRPSQ
jgi:adenine-specific DNA methylase